MSIDDIIVSVAANQEDLVKNIANNITITSSDGVTDVQARTIGSLIPGFFIVKLLPYGVDLLCLINPWVKSFLNLF